MTAPMYRKTVPMRVARRRLAVMWFCGAGILVLVVVLQSIFGKYGNKTAEAWQWLLPSVLPTLSLIIGILVANALNITAPVRLVDRFFYRLTCSLSGGYLTLVGLTIAITPFADAPPLELMNMSNLWLGPFQGLVGAALAVFFVSRDKGEDSDTGYDQS